MLNATKKQCQKALLLFIKNPVKGKVKTRLAADLGDDKALEIYKLLLKHTRAVTLEISDTRRYLFYDQEVVQDDDWSPAFFEKYVQVEGDLGLRMKDAFSQAFDSNAEKVVIIGSDCAQLKSSDIKEAYKALDHSDVVFGPAMDGGYYLCGLRSRSLGIFDLKAWSTDSVLEDSIAICREEGLSVSLLRTLSDIDHASDWENYGFE